MSVPERVRRAPVSLLTGPSVICLDVVEKSHEVRDLPCAHVFHTACLDGWVSRGHYYCPLCHGLVMQLLRDQPEAASQV